MGVYTDDFNRGSLGANWSNGQGSPSLSITSNTVRAGASGWVYGYWSANTVGADQYSQVKITAADGADSNDIGPCIRVTGGGTPKCYGWFGSGSKSFDGAWSGATRSGFSTSSAAFAVNDIIRMEGRGRWLTYYKNGYLLYGIRADSTLASGQPGIGGFGVGTIDTADDWEGGDLSAVGGTTATGIVSDNFVRANGSLCTASSGTNSGNWQAAAGGGITGLVIASNQLKGNSTSSAYCLAAWRTHSFPADQRAKLTIAQVGSSNVRTMGPAVRISIGSDVTGYFVEIYGTSTVLQRGTTSGGGSIIAATLGTHTDSWAAGDTCELEIVGSSLTVRRNGASILTATDSTYSSGQPGLVMWSDGLATQPIASAWEAAPIVAATASNPIVMCIT